MVEDFEKNGSGFAISDLTSVTLTLISTGGLEKTRRYVPPPKFVNRQALFIPKNEGQVHTDSCFLWVLAVGLVLNRCRAKFIDELSELSERMNTQELQHFVGPIYELLLSRLNPSQDLPVVIEDQKLASVLDKLGLKVNVHVFSVDVKTQVYYCAYMDQRNEYKTNPNMEHLTRNEIEKEVEKFNASQIFVFHYNTDDAIGHSGLILNCRSFFNFLKSSHHQTFFCVACQNLISYKFFSFHYSICKYINPEARRLKLPKQILNEQGKYEPPPITYLKNMNPDRVSMLCSFDSEMSFSKRSSTASDSTKLIGTADAQISVVASAIVLPVYPWESERIKELKSTVLQGEFNVGPDCTLKMIKEMLLQGVQCMKIIKEIECAYAKLPPMRARDRLFAQSVTRCQYCNVPFSRGKNGEFLKYFHHSHWASPSFTRPPSQRQHFTSKPSPGTSASDPDDVGFGLVAICCSRCNALRRERYPRIFTVVNHNFFGYDAMPFLKAIFDAQARGERLIRDLKVLVSTESKFRAMSFKLDCCICYPSPPESIYASKEVDEPLEADADADADAEMDMDVDTEEDWTPNVFKDGDSDKEDEVCIGYWKRKRKRKLTTHFHFVKGGTCRHSPIYRVCDSYRYLPQSLRRITEDAAAEIQEGKQSFQNVFPFTYRFLSMEKYLNFIPEADLLSKQNYPYAQMTSEDLNQFLFYDTYPSSVADWPVVFESDRVTENDVQTLRRLFQNLTAWKRDQTGNPLAEAHYYDVLKIYTYMDVYVL